LTHVHRLSLGLIETRLISKSIIGMTDKGRENINLPFSKDGIGNFR